MAVVCALQPIRNQGALTRGDLFSVALDRQPGRKIAVAALAASDQHPPVGEQHGGGIDAAPSGRDDLRRTRGISARLAAVLPIDPLDIVCRVQVAADGGSDGREEIVLAEA